MRTVLPEAPATYFRLSEDSKAKAVAEYLKGRTAKAVGRKWRVSAGSIYRWALEAGHNKRRDGDGLARANAEAVEAEEAARVERTFAEPPPLIAEVPADAEPAALAQAALRGVGEAMRQERLDEAKLLAQLSEALVRVADRAPSTTLETVARALTDEGYATELFAVWGDPNPPAIKRWLWQNWRAPSHMLAEIAQLRGEVARLKAERLSTGSG